MSYDHDPHVLVIETGKGLQVASMSRKKWLALSATYAEDDLSVGGIYVHIKRQRWLDEMQTQRAVYDWAGDVFGAPF